MTDSVDQYDISILGSGFGGSLLASILSQQGFKVCLIDKSVHPRFAIGESSTPAADMILHSLAIKYQLDELVPLSRFGTWRDRYPDIRCGCKRGFSYFWHGGDSGFCATKNHDHELFVAASGSKEVADTQWYRPDVDQFICNMAVKRGVVLHASCEVKNIHHRGQNSWELNLNGDDCPQRIQCSLIIDATGVNGLLTRSLEIEDLTHRLHTKTSAIYSHFDNVPTVDEWLTQFGVQQADYPYPADDSAVHHLFNNGWLWQLRFENGPTSLGFVQTGELQESQLTPQEHWDRLLNSHSALQGICSGMKRSAFPGKIYCMNRLQHLFAESAGDDWAALPFTTGFIDPLHSTGIAHTLIAVQRLAEILSGDGIQGAAKQLRGYSQQVVRELLHIDRLVAGCYRHLGKFEKFSAWTMVYFAAAIKFETRYHFGGNDFLCAADDDFHGIVERLFSELCSLNRSECSTKQFADHIRREIDPFNVVGLFDPEVKNMHKHTAIEK